MKAAKHTHTYTHKTKMVRVVFRPGGHLCVVCLCCLLCCLLWMMVEVRGVEKDIGRVFVVKKCLCVFVCS